MGTRGLYGFRKNGVDKVTYNHYDSYPEYLGRNILEFIRNHGEKLNSIFDNIIMVNEDDIPTKEQIEECKEYCDTNVSKQTEEEWYCLLHKTQGDLEPYINGLKYMTDSHEFILDSLFCEYAYIINLDTNKLEFWVGFQKKPDETNRYGIEMYDNYYPCKLIKEYDLDMIMNNQELEIDYFVEDMEEEAKEDE
ncbi:MAG: hypothetical protein J6T10_24600 [Methanobrevibacter sp.]|nr:hypothetical protein [Methanobrevibacter sp.]